MHNNHHTGGSSSSNDLFVKNYDGSNDACRNNAFRRRFVLLRFDRNQEQGFGKQGFLD